MYFPLPLEPSVCGLFTRRRGMKSLSPRMRISRGLPSVTRHSGRLSCAKVSHI